MGPSSGNERFYVTGSSSALGSWVVKQLLDTRTEVVVNGDDDRRLRLIANPQQLTEVKRVDDLDAGMAGVTHVVHASTLTDEGCLADPAASALSAIGGFADMIRAAVEAGVTGMAYQSSMSVFASSAVHVDENTEPSPSTVRGSYELAQEILARRCFCEFGLSNCGLRTSLVYGPGQDPALDGGASTAIAAAVEERWSKLDYWGPADFQYVADVAAALVDAARGSNGTCEVHNLTGDQASMLDFAHAVAASTGVDRVTTGPVEFPLPAAAHERDSLATSLEAGVRATAEAVRWAPKDLYSWN